MSARLAPVGLGPLGPLVESAGSRLGRRRFDCAVCDARNGDAYSPGCLLGMTPARALEHVLARHRHNYSRPLVDALARIEESDDTIARIENAANVRKAEREIALAIMGPESTLFEDADE